MSDLISNFDLPTQQFTKLLFQSKPHQTMLDSILMRRAQFVSQNSDDPKARIDPRSGVGAILFHESGLYQESANVFPDPIAKTGYSLTATDNAERYTMIEHAERSCIFRAAQRYPSIKNANLYCTRFPCSDCARTIIQFAITRLVVSSGFSGEERWRKSQSAALKALRISGITIRYFSKDNWL